MTDPIWREVDPENRWMWILERITCRIKGHQWATAEQKTRLCFRCNRLERNLREQENHWKLGVSS